MPSDVINNPTITTIAGTFTLAFVVVMMVTIAKKLGMPSQFGALAAVLASIAAGLLWAVLQPGPLPMTAEGWAVIIVIILSTAYISVASYDSIMAPSKAKEHEQVKDIAADALGTDPHIVETMAKLQLQPIEPKLIPDPDTTGFMTQAEQEAIINKPSLKVMPHPSEVEPVEPKETELDADS